jgi:serine/threonine protein kinase
MPDAPEEQLDDRTARYIPAPAGEGPRPGGSDSDRQLERRLTEAITGAAAYDPLTEWVGQTLETYAVKEFAKRGGQGGIFRGLQHGVEREVAIKIVPRQADNAADLNALQEEARVLARLNKDDFIADHLVQLYHLGGNDRGVWLVMEWLDGDNVEERLSRRGPLPWREAFAIAICVLKVLERTHARGLAHFDIKPTNIFVTRQEGRVKLLDFGMARICDRLFGQPQLCVGRGTPQYASPEQLLGPQADHRADLYAVGATLFHMLTDQRPYAQATTLGGLLEAHKGPVPRPSAVKPDLPDCCDRIVARAMAHDVSARYQDAAEFRKDLERALKQPAGARPLVGRAAVFLGLCALISLGVVGALLVRERSDPPLPPGPPGPKSDSRGPAKQGAGHILVRKLEVSHRVRVGAADEPRGALGKNSFATRLHDIVTIAAELTEPAYCYLIAFRPDGQDELCFPESDTVRPAKTTRPSYPLPGRKEGFGLDEGTGLQAFFLVVSRAPLPSYREWRKERGRSPWRPTRAAPNLVWRYDGVQVTAYSPDQPGGQRAKGVKLQGTDAMSALAEWLPRPPEVEAVEGIGFAVLPR